MSGSRRKEKKKLELPHLLTEAVKNSRAILFLGAGSSKECTDENGNSPPDADQLRDILATKFFGREMPNRDVMSVAEMAIANGSGQNLVFDEVNRAFEGYHTSEAHKLVSEFNWRAIATTNYDLFLEAAYSDPTRRRQTLVPFVKDDEPVDARMGAVLNPVQYLKLHGSLDHRLDKDVPLILSWEQYDSYSKNRTRLFSRLEYLAHECPIIFVGYRLGDSHIRSLFYKLQSDNRPRWYIVDPGAEPEDVAFWASKNVEAFPVYFRDFMEALDGAVPKLLRFITPSTGTIEFPLRNYYSAPTEESEIVRGSLNKDITLVHSSMSYAEQTAERFYSGYDTGWGCIFKRFDARRRVTDELLYKALLENETPTGPVFFLLQGPAGAGKTIVLKRTAFDAATANNALVLWLEENGQLRPEVFYEIHELTQRPIYLFVDQVALHVDKLIDFLLAMKTRSVPVVVVGAEREADWITYCGALEEQFPPHPLRLGALSSAETEAILDLLERHKCLGELEGQSRDEQIEAFMSVEHADRQLLVALHVLTKGLPFEQIVLNEFEAVNPERARRLYLDIATMNQFGVAVRAGTISRISGIDFREYQEKFFAPLKDIVVTKQDPYTGDYTYKTRHARVAQILFRQACGDEAAKVAQFTRLIQGFDVGFSSDRRALEGICKGRTLVENFSDPIGVREIFQEAIRAAPEQAYLCQQWAIFESSHPKGDFLEAEKHADKAASMEPGNRVFIHTQAEVARKRAVFEQSPVLKEQLRRRARVFLDRMPSGDRFVVSSRCKLLVDEIADLSDTLTDDGRTSEDTFFAEKLEDAETALAKAQQDFPSDPELFEIEARLWSEMRDKNRALKALERAWARNPKRNGTAIRIGKIYAAAGKMDEQDNILREALARNPEDKPTHLAFAQHLLTLEPPDVAAAEVHLKRSFTSDDQNFEARYSYAEFLFYKGEVEKAAEAFADINQRAPNSFRRHAPKRDTTISSRLPTYEGTVESVKDGYSFIRSGAYPRPVFAHWSSYDENEIDALEVGMKVLFRVRFNRAGPTAVDIRLKA